jgi:hypothetical protein
VFVKSIAEFLRKVTNTLQLLALLGGNLKMSKEEKLASIKEILIIILLLFAVIFAFLLLLDWFKIIDFIPGVGEGSGVGFLPDFFGLR